MTAADLAALRDAALRYASHGWPVFPCKPNRKEPATVHGFKDAFTSTADVCGWWKRTPYNIGIATGAPGPDVLDFDLYKPGSTGMEAFRRLKAAGLLAGPFALIRTRAGGLHLYFAGSDQPGASGLGGYPVDFRARGGYVVAPPSYVQADDKGPAGRYELLEKRPYTGATFDLDAARHLLAPPQPDRPRRASGEPQPGHGWFRMDRMAAYVAGLPEGVRNSGFYWACCRAIEAGASDLSDLVSAAVSAGLPEPEAWRTARSAERTAGS